MNKELEFENSIKNILNYIDEDVKRRTFGYSKASSKSL